VSVRRRRRRKTGNTLPGWAWMSFGLALGLVMAGLVYLATDRNPAETAPVPAAAAPVPASPAAPRPAAAPPADANPDNRTQFDFYEMLPSFEVVVPEYESQPRADRRPTVISDPGSYVIQAGSFKTYADADARAASLALIGIEARIQRVTIDSEVFHRVRVGPISDLDQLNRVRAQLRDARIEVLLMRVP
jgi:cell division protein FtsN